MKRFLTLLAICFCGAAVMGAEKIFEVRESSQDTFEIIHRGKPLFKNIRSIIRPDGGTINLKRDCKTLEDGTQVWNIWCEDFELKFRMEVVLPASGEEVEMSLLGEAPADPKFPHRQLTLEADYSQFKDMPFTGVKSHSRSKHIIAKGVFDDKLPEGYLHNDIWRFLAFSGHRRRKKSTDHHGF